MLHIELGPRRHVGASWLLYILIRDLLICTPIPRVLPSGLMILHLFLNLLGNIIDVEVGADHLGKLSGAKAVHHGTC
jgi:hypothetical protein